MRLNPFTFYKKINQNKSTILVIIKLEFINKIRQLEQINKTYNKKLNQQIKFNMNTRKSWGRTIESEQQSFLMQSFISNITLNDFRQKDDVARELEEMDKRYLVCHIQFIDCLEFMRLNFMILFQSPIKSLPKYYKTVNYLSLKLTLQLMHYQEIPQDAIKSNFISYIQNRYAKSYLQILDQTTVTQDKQKQKRIQQVKKKFAQSNSHIDFCANSKPYSPFKLKQNFRPVVDNEHQAYLKTQLIFLQKPKGGNITDKQYYDKHYDLITKKIEQLGGMEDTLGKMEDTLSQNQVKNFKRRQILQELSTPRKNPFSSPQKVLNSQSSKGGQSWIQRSRALRQNFKNKLHIS